MYANVVMGVITVLEKGLSILLHGVISLSDATSYDSVDSN